MTQEQLQQYFARIEYTPDRGETQAQALIRVHRSHAYHIPFENLDVYLGGRPALDEDALVDKLVLRRRGGYCFEQNGLLCAALTAMGYEVRSVLARGMRDDGVMGGLAHRMNVVILDDGSKWIADVGFGGDGLVEPVRISETPMVSHGVTYRVVDGRAGGMTYCLQSLGENGFQDRFYFHELPNLQSDFEMANFFTSTHPDSGFRNHIRCALPTPHGRIALSDDRLRVVENGQITDRFFTPPELPDLLDSRYGIKLTPEAAATLADMDHFARVWPIFAPSPHSAGAGFLGAYVPTDAGAL